MDTPLKTTRHPKPLKPTVDQDPQPLAQRPDRRISWEWNIPLLSASVGILLVAGILFGVLYSWQSSNLARELKEKADLARTEQDYKEQARWLGRYVQLVPSDTEAILQHAIAVDSSVTTLQDLNSARKHLSAAIAVAGEDHDPTEIADLRSRLIERLLQLGINWASEAERQVLLLAFPSADPKGLSWLARSLALQRSASQYQNRDPQQFERQSDFWKWAANQPTGEVLKMAVDAKPDDVRLTSQLISACLQNPDWFDQPGKAADREELKAIATKALERLKANTENAQAQLMAYVYEYNLSPQDATTFIASAVEPAFSRLEAGVPTLSIGSQEAPSETNVFSESIATQFSQLSAPDAYLPYWDWQLIVEAAKSQVTGGQLPQAIDILERLITFDGQAISRRQREETFELAASAQMAIEDYEAAIQNLRVAIEAVPESLDLTGRLVNAYIASEDIQEAERYAEEFSNIVERLLLRLDGVEGAKLSVAGRERMRKRLELGEWEADLLQARIHHALKDYGPATTFAEACYGSHLLLDNSQRLAAGRLLADCYLGQRLWDLAGKTLDGCLVMAPQDMELRRRTAETWRLAGATQRATQQLTALDDGSFASALNIARLKALSEASKPAGKADLAIVRNQLRTARQRYEAASPEEQSSLELWRLEVLEIAYGSLGGSDVPDNTDLYTALANSAARHPDVGELQIQVALTLAAGGEADLSQQALERLEKIALEHPDADNRANFELTRARLAAIAKDNDRALELIRQAIESVPERRLMLAKAGADIALRENRLQEARELLKSVPEDELDIDSLVTLVGAVRLLDEEHGFSPEQVDQEFQNWIQVLKGREGVEGTHWRYAEAERLLQKIDETLADGGNPRPLLDEATLLYNELHARRPYWGRAAALGAAIAARKGFSSEAIRLLRQAERDGDRQVSSILLLAKELIKLKRPAEAEAALERIKNIPDAVVPWSAMVGDLAQKQGDYDRALDLARTATTERPRDINAWLILAQTAQAAAKATEESREDLYAEAWQAYETALNLARVGNRKQLLTVIDARFRYQKNRGDTEAARRELTGLKQFGLPASQQLLVLGRGYLQLEDLGKAREALQQSLAADSNNPEIHLAMSDLHTRLGDTESALASLRNAHKVAPNNQNIRQQLALALTFLAGDHFQWQEVDRLLGQADASETPKAKLIRALITLSKDTGDRRDAAIQSLRELAVEVGSVSDDAKRLLATHYALLWRTDRNGADSATAVRNFAEAESFYQDLLRTPEPVAMDAFQYANLLFNAAARAERLGRTQEVHGRLGEVERAIRKLEAITGSSLASLQLRLRAAKLRSKVDGTEAEVGEIASQIAEKWLVDAGDLQTLGASEMSAIIGKTLADEGFADQSLVWLEEIYKQDRSQYQLYAVGLAKAQKFNEAIEICMRELRGQPTAEAAALVLEVLMLNGGNGLSGEVEQTIVSAMAQFPRSPSLLEAMGTFRMMQDDFLQAIALFEKVEQLAPNRVRTLNNLAIALTKIPMRKQEALARIEKAISLMGPNPELLDTKGVVLFQLGRLGEAEQVLREASMASPDPEFKIHLIEVLLATPDVVAARQVWKTIDHTLVQQTSLPATEQRKLDEFRRQLGETL